MLYGDASKGLIHANFRAFDLAACHLVRGWVHEIGCVQRLPLEYSAFFGAETLYLSICADNQWIAEQ